MLVLARKPGQRLIIAGDIEVTILDIKGDLVKLGIEAPRHVSIYRHEVYEDICRANQAASAELPQTLAAVLDQIKEAPPSTVGSAAVLPRTAPVAATRALLLGKPQPTPTPDTPQQQ
jgi:carbon storage regulator